ncbi:hypothetical protein BDV59DRAFT_120943 [Aspergillus ambiguus]|uniref:uncharacterized protein n=1 Tax=Aspergillus ambiguus TaxID=176160 RepID=UPI003CCCBE8A
MDDLNNMVRHGTAALHAGQIEISGFLKQMAEIFALNKDVLPQEIKEPLQSAFGRKPRVTHHAVRSKEAAFARIQSLAPEQIVLPDLALEAVNLYKNDGSLFWRYGIRTDNKRTHDCILSDLYYGKKRIGISNSIRSAFHSIAVYKIIHILIEQSGQKRFSKQVEEHCTAIILNDSKGDPTEEDGVAIMKNLREEYTKGKRYTHYTSRMGYGFIFYMFAVPSTVYEKYLTKSDDAEAVRSYLRSIGFNVDTDSQTAGNNIINDAVNCFRSQLTTFALIWMMPSSSVKTSRVTKNRGPGPVRRRHKKLREFDNGCPNPQASNTIDGCYERSGRAADYTVSLPNHNLTIDSILDSVDQTTMEAEFRSSTAPMSRGAEAHSVFNPDAVNAAQLMQSFDVTSFPSASQLMQAFDLATFDFQNSGQLVEETNFAQTSSNVLQNTETPMQR